MAYVGLADSYLMRATAYGPMSAQEAYKKATQTAQKALAIDSTLAEAYTSLAFIDLANGNILRAEERYKKAIKLKPSYAQAHQWYSLVLMVTERYEETIAEIKYARELDPLSIMINTQVGWPYLYLKQYDKAIEIFNSALEMDTNFPLAIYNLGLVYREKRMYEKSIGYFQKAIALTNNTMPVFKAQMGVTYAWAGKNKEAMEILDELIEAYHNKAASPTNCASLYAALGDKDNAFKWLEIAYQERATLLVMTRIDTIFDNLRDDPRYPELIKRIFQE